MRTALLLAAVVPVAVLAPAAATSAQQVPDSAFTWRPTKAEFLPESGPVILVDGSHNNVHTIGGQFRGFATVARSDGFRVQSLDGPLTPEALARCDVFVIASPRHPHTLQSKERPILPAYSDEEISVLVRWVRAGGSLLLVSDHMPIAGSMSNLAPAFGFTLIDGFAADSSDSTARVPMTLRRRDRTLLDHPITNGRTRAERIDSVTTFDGAAFTSAPGARTMLRLSPHTLVIIPNEPWVFLPQTPRVPASGLTVGATRVMGNGRVALVAEAAMFTAQLQDADRHAMGMNHPAAAQNPQFVVNVLHWLVGRLPAR